MIVFVSQRLAQTAGVLLIMSILVFASVYAIGNPIDILVNPQADQADIARATAALGLDQPVWKQYGIFLHGALTGNLGKSFIYDTSAIALILERMPATLELSIVAMAIAVLLGVPLGLWAGLRPHSLSGKAIMAGSIFGFSLPTFWVGLMMIMLFSVQLGWLPSSGRGPTTEIAGFPISLFSAEGWKHILMPAVNLALFKLSMIIRLTRAGTREALLQDYVRYARAKGLPERRVIGVHVLKPIMTPIVTVIGLEFGSLIAFAVVTESIFSWPGMGKLLLESINQLDRPVIVSYLLLTVLLYALINLAVDIAYALLDPRVRLNGAGK